MGIYILCLSVCLYVSYKRQNGWIDRAQILCGTSHDPREGLRMLRVTKSCIPKLLIFVKSEKMREKIFENPQKNCWYKLYTLKNEDPHRYLGLKYGMCCVKRLKSLVYTYIYIYTWSYRNIFRSWLNSWYTVVGDYTNTIKTKFLIVNKLYSKYKFTRNQRTAFLIHSFSWLPCLCRLCRYRL